MTETSVSGATPCMRFDMSEANRLLQGLVAEKSQQTAEVMDEIRWDGGSFFRIEKTEVVGDEFWTTYALHPDLQALLEVD